MSNHRTRYLAGVAGAVLLSFIAAAGAQAGPRAKDVELTLLSSTSNRGEIEPCG